VVIRLRLVHVIRSPYSPLRVTGPTKWIPPDTRSGVGIIR
jgi:hypothetical protein